MMSLLHKSGVCVLAVLALACVGCMQIETRVKINADGSATVTERVRFSNRLLDVKLEGSPAADMNALLEKAAFERRATQLGEGCTLASHNVKTVPDGKEAIAIYKLDDINKLRYVSPYLAYADYAENNIISFSFEPTYKSRPGSGTKAGQMSLNLRFEKQPKGQPQLEKDKPPPPGPSPKDLQVFRELMPAVRDMLSGFEFRLTVETYGPIDHSGFGLRNRQALPKEIDFFWFNDTQLDKFGDRVVENEEMMLAMARLDFGNKVLTDQMSNFANNETMPVHLPIGSAYMWWTGGIETSIRPSRQLFDKHFVGKKLNYNEWGEKPTDTLIPAEFEKIGMKQEGK